jgi:hypothetical protein
MYRGFIAALFEGIPRIRFLVREDIGAAFVVIVPAKSSRISI